MTDSQLVLIKKSKVLLTEKYDIVHKILNELVHLESRYILFSIIKHPKSIKDISREQKIPISSVYKKMMSLKECSLIHENQDFATNNHITRYYQSKIKDIKISITKFEPEISFTENKLVKN